jgi:FtsP/CotA-like multicopper oxidase with cupredoxin domain
LGAQGPGQPNVLSGTEFDLTIGETPMNFTGKTRTAITVNGSVPAPLLRWREGTTVNLRVSNALPANSSMARTPPSIGTASFCRPTWTACRA